MRQASPEALAQPFEYDQAFSRNIGWVTEWEQQELRGKVIAIAGLGGVGGAHLLTLARLGVGSFHISDLDHFEIANINRQVGAGMSTLGRDKADVMARMAWEVNPELKINIFGTGIDDANIDKFLEGVDLFVDGFDFFVMDIRRKVFAHCAELGIPAITAAPIGFGTAYVIFMPGRMTFEQYFRLDGLPENRQYVNFAVGLTPKGFHRNYLVDPSRLDLSGKRGPSTAAAIQLCAGVVGAESSKILLGRKPVRAAPWHHQFDVYRGAWKRGYLPFGAAGPIQVVKRHIGYKAFERLTRNSRPVEKLATGSDLEKILDLARWAPSGDNSQPWSFEIVDENKILISIQIEGENRNIYDFNGGQPTLLSAGFLLETMRIAASRFGRNMVWKHLHRDERDLSIEAVFSKDRSLKEDPLCAYIKIRSVNRRSYRNKRLSAAQKSVLESALGDDLVIEWHETIFERWRSARLNACATDLRLRLRKAYDVHQRILDWDQNFSPTGVPVNSIGLDFATLKLMRWVMRDWRRVEFTNRFLFGTLMPRIQLDILPGLFCSAHFSIYQRNKIASKDELQSVLEIGGALQRFWLLATKLGLAVQPSLSPICFAHYSQRRENVLALDEHDNSTKKIRLILNDLSDRDPNDAIFLGRVGFPLKAGANARSVRRL